MKRDYANKKEKQLDATFFHGFEIEKSPAEGMSTLFVVGLHSFNEIINMVVDCNNVPEIKHIYFGANQSFQPVDYDDWHSWENMITSVLDAGYWATLDMDLSYATDLLEGGLTEKRRFIPMISIKLPYLAQYNYNTTIKIDDKGFDATNPGVWCHRLSDLTRTDKFTSWDEYGEDKLIK